MTDHELAVAGFWVSLVGSVATVAALVVAIVIGVREARSFRADALARDVDRRAEAERRRRAQAETVTAQLHVDPKGGHYVAELAHLANHFRYHTWVDVFNRSSLPIYEVEVVAPAPDDPGHRAVGRAELVAGGQTGHIHVPGHPDLIDNGSPIAVTFTDSAGTRWHRHLNGVLDEAIQDSGPMRAPSWSRDSSAS